MGMIDQRGVDARQLFDHSGNTVAVVPVDLVDLEDANVEGAVRVVVHGIGVATALLTNDALAALLSPAVVARADLREASESAKMGDST